MDDESARRRAAPQVASRAAERRRARGSGGSEPLERTRVSTRRILAELAVIAVFALGVWQIAVLLLAFAGR